MQTAQFPTRGRSSHKTDRDLRQKRLASSLDPGAGVGTLGLGEKVVGVALAAPVDELLAASTLHAVEPARHGRSAHARLRRQAA